MAEGNILLHTNAETATDMLDSMLAAGRISKQEFDTLKANSVAMNDFLKPHTHIAGNVTICSNKPLNELKAISRVLNTPELLEQILVWLPALDLLHRAPSVCKAFLAVMKVSKPIRRKTFFEPDHKCSETTPIPFRFHRRKLVKREMEENTFGLVIKSKRGRLPFQRSKSDSLQSLLVFQPPQKAVTVVFYLQFGRKGRGIHSHDDEIRVEAADGIGVRMAELSTSVLTVYNRESKKAASDGLGRSEVQGWEVVVLVDDRSVEGE